jgi:hypothetical protein
MKKAKYRGGPSEILEPIEFDGYKIKSLKHGNTGHTLYYFPSEEHEWEGCWTMDLETAKKGVQKYKKYLAENKAATV